MKKYMCIAAIALLVMVALSAAAYAAPANATDISRGISERASSGGAGDTEPAEAGNTTALTILATDTSRRWQGFYGNVTGNITLADSSSNALYNWVNINPAGEVYAANDSSVNWPKIFCVNFSANVADETLNKDTLNSYIGYTSDEDKARQDSVNSTFNQTFTGSLAVGSRTLTGADNCSMATLNTGTGYQDVLFRELLLTDNQSVVFASILENNANGFKSHPTDFEMIVGVNGTVLYTPRNYYFYVELS